MAQPMVFGEVLEAVERLSDDEQETLVSIVEHRLAERRRRLLAADIQEARQAFANAQARPASLDELMDEIMS